MIEIAKQARTEGESKTRLGARRILILTADTGFGHRSAANAIAIALQETHGDDCIVEIVNPLEDRRVPGLLRRSQADYDRIVREMPNLYELGYEASDTLVPSAVIERALVVMLFDVMRDIIRRHQPDALITTYPLYQASLQAVYSMRRQYVPSLTVVTDLATVHRLWFHPVADLCIVPTEAVRDLALEHGIAEARIKITGIPVHPDLARESRDRCAIRAELGWQQDKTTVLAVGSKRVGHLFGALRALNHSGLPLQLAVVAGGDETLYRQIEATEWHIVTHRYNFVTNMPTLMRAADCIVCKAGGLIVTEALACGLPLLLIDVLPGQEAGNAEYVIRGGAGKHAEDPLDALETLYHWLEHGGARLAKYAVNARRLGRPLAAYEVAEHVWAAAERGAVPQRGRHNRRRRRIPKRRRRPGMSGR
jgi:1,2-diacylglycerol 3-beta-galactosyltransferase